MSVLKSVIITLPKGLSKAPGIVVSNELPRSVAKFNFTNSMLTDKSRMDSKRITKHKDTRDESALFKTDSCVRGKKRRLDHLTWEEKLQRKKLKNRVAAQTSRDRKKAKLDELEDTVRTLREQNELLTQECSMLRSQNDLLVTETKRLRREKDTKYSGELIWWNNAAGTVSGANPRNSNFPEDTDHLPPLEDLFGDLQGDDYIERLEELAESLLREVNAEVEANPHTTNEQVSVQEGTIERHNHSKGVVGQASKNVEAGRTYGSMSTHQSWHPVTSTVTTPCTTSTTALASIKSEIQVKQEVDTHDLDTVYGTYDETSNSITIIYPGEENSVGIQECVQEVSTDEVCLAEDTSCRTPNRYYSDQLSPSYTCTDSMSPSSIHSEDMDSGFTQTKLDSNASDCGYESHDSPIPDTRNEKGNVALADLWHESFSELFPTLA
ncbi:X-box-binding protein 1 [Dufourea novaeangliae]|uniref:X-box-binding protein 1 n=1 Tax=Dufourea novaeangliae TaxID=178035 RepID=A0A154P366_DUFNO|nr:X-box-binding protein 1 [Dufourea novaeangliae]